MQTDRSVLIAKTGVLAAPFVLLFICLLLFGSSLKHWSSSIQHGTQSQTKRFGHYEFMSSQDPSLYLNMATQIQLFETLLVETFGEDFQLTTFEKPLTIHVYLTRETLNRYIKTTTGLKESLVYNDGIYNPTHNEIGILFGTDEQVNLSGVLHEVTHALLDISARDAAWSSWYSEGIATYFAMSNMSQEILGGIDKHMTKVAQKAIQHNQFISIQHILNATPAEFTSATNAIYYAESHLLFAFLIDHLGRKGRDNLFEYHRIQRSSRKASVQDFERIFGDLESLNKDFIQFIHSLQN